MFSWRHGIGPERLRSIIHRYREAHFRAYGDHWIKPKWHYILHLPDMLERHGTLFSTLVNERRHKVVKTYTKDRRSKINWERGSLEEIISRQMHESTLDWYVLGPVEPHAATGRLAFGLREAFPDEVADMQVANSMRHRRGVSVVGDVVVLAGDKLGVLQCICMTREREYALVSEIRETGRNASRDWATGTLTGQCLILSGSDVECSTVHKASEGAYSVYMPMSHC